MGHLLRINNVYRVQLDIFATLIPRVPHVSLVMPALIRLEEDRKNVLSVPMDTYHLQERPPVNLVRQAS